MILIRKIDKIDARILKDLLIYGRKPFTEIAKDVGTTKDIIWQHYRRMKKEGIIIGSTIQANYQRLGYISAASFFITFESQKKDQTIRGVQKIPGIDYSFHLGGCQKIWAITDFRNMDEIEEVRHFLGKVPSVLKVDIDMITGFRNMPENLSVLSTNETLRSYDSTKLKVGNDAKTDAKIDEIDIQIIEKLATNGRMSFRKIAKELKISTATTARRYTKLRIDGVIRPLIQINLKKTGYVANAFFRLKFISQRGVNQRADEISKISDVNGILKTSGVFDLTVYANVKSVEHLIDLQNEISDISGIFEMETVMHNSFKILPYWKEHLSTF